MLKKYFLKTLFTLGFSIIILNAAKAQTPKKYVEDVFKGTQIVNSQTTKMMMPGSWKFEIQHRFGVMGLDSSFVQEFLGMDLPAVMRFSFGWAVNDNFYFNIGRSNYLKTYDGEFKYLLLKQTEDFKIPVSVAFYGNASLRTERFPNVPAGAVFEDDTTAFVYKPKHRLMYNTQLVISSKINEKLSLQVTPIFIYRNLAPAYHDNFSAVISGSGRYKIGTNSSLLLEYAHVVNNRKNDFINPFSAGIEFGTANHVFQVFLSNSTRILESNVYTESSEKIMDGKFLLGFNLQRFFWRKNYNN